MISLIISSHAFFFFLSLSLYRCGRRRMFVTSTLYPVVTVTLTSVQWQWIKVTLTSYTLTDMCIRIHTSTHKHINASTPLQTRTHADTYTYTLLLCISLWLACPGSLSSSLTNELEAAPLPPLPSPPPSSPQMVFFLPAQSHVGQQGQTTFKDNSNPLSLSPSPSILPLYHPLFVCISMENEQESEPVPSPNPLPDPSIHPSYPSVCLPPPPPSPIMYPSRQTNVLALLQFWKWHGGLSLDRMMMMIIIIILMKNKWFLFRWTLHVSWVNLLHVRFVCVSGHIQLLK